MGWLLRVVWKEVPTLVLRLVVAFIFLSLVVLFALLW
jgi:hypothetical protein